jgi:hypothetical protein
MTFHGNSFKQNFPGLFRRRHFYAATFIRKVWFNTAPNLWLALAARRLIRKQKKLAFFRDVN